MIQLFIPVKIEIRTMDFKLEQLMRTLVYCKSCTMVLCPRANKTSNNSSNVNQNRTIGYKNYHRIQHSALSYLSSLLIVFITENRHIVV